MVKFKSEPVRKHKISDISAIGLDVFFLYSVKQSMSLKSGHKLKRQVKRDDGLQDVHIARASTYVVKNIKYTSYD